MIAFDYLLSVESRERRDAYLRVHDPERAAFLAALPPSVLAMDAATIDQLLSELRAQHGSVREFLVGAALSASDLDALVSALVEN